MLLVTLSPHPPCLPLHPLPQSRMGGGRLESRDGPDATIPSSPQRVARQEPQSLHLFPIRVSQSPQTSRVREGGGGELISMRF